MKRVSKSFSLFTTSFVSAIALLLSAGASASEAGAEGHHDFHAGVFTGVTIGEHESAFTLGADYEYRISEPVGIVALVDLAFFHEIVGLYGAGLMVHATGPLRFLAAPAVEIAHGETAFALRGGVAYDFHVGSLTIAPTANFDLVHEHVAKVFGITVGTGF